MIPWKLPRNTAFPLISTAPLLVSGRQVRLGRHWGSWLSGVLCRVGLCLMGLCKWILIVKSILSIGRILDLQDTLEINPNPLHPPQPWRPENECYLRSVLGTELCSPHVEALISTVLGFEMMGFVSLLRGDTRGAPRPPSRHPWVCCCSLFLSSCGYCVSWDQSPEP